LLLQRFLKALGYLSTLDRPASVDEEIQMHADRLYHRMLEREKAIKDAEAAGLPVPSFPPILASGAQAAGAGTRAESVQRASDDGAEEEDGRVLPQATFGKRLEGLSPQEREVEEKAIAAEIEAGFTAKSRLEELNQGKRQAREKRIEEGKATVWDRIGGLFGR
jgi:hypothetical protein